MPRCADIHLTLRALITGEQARWVTTAERRQRGAVCRTRYGLMRYTTYTEERWQQARTGS